MPAQIRRQGEWMRPVDERILEHLSERALSSSPRVILSRTEFHDLDVSKIGVRERLRVLSQAGLVEPSTPNHGSFELTVWGRMYLDGDVAADQIVPYPDARRAGYVLG
ncbi:hypothetical protein [Halocalculus aciditolerans]|uniref:Repressor phrH2 n=1 Tax=Halocalculus aciditolerans TaxID=1383812 RepID=A0A830F339_9EURY|nr:hypothetical protein [Halocalculus aciditolerans]GGL58021.1 hypothetical protein GCM10009039_15280 [Halocalculus aciditolerans]